MRITHVITRLLVGGAQENTVATVLGLRSKPGLDVCLISGANEGVGGSLEGNFASCPDALVILPSLVRPVHPFQDWIALRQLTAIFRRTRPDVVHTHSSKAGVLGRLAAHRAGVPVIIHTVHGPSFGDFQGRLPNLAFRAAERLAARVTTHFVSVADAMTRQYLAAGIGHPGQYTRVFSGFPLEPFLAAKNSPQMRRRLGLQPDDLVVGTIARLFKLKGHDDLLEAAPALLRQCPQMKFLLVGDGPWRERLEEKARQLGVRERVVFAGLVSPEAVPSYVGVMDLLVHLSLREGLPRALPQALAASKPVVAYDCDGAGEVCLDGETGFLIRPGDQPRLIESMLRLAREPVLRERLGSRGRELVRQNFAVEKMVDDLHALCLNLAARHGISQRLTPP